MCFECKNLFIKSLPQKNTRVYTAKAPICIMVLSSHSLIQRMGRPEELDIVPISNLFSEK